MRRPGPRRRAAAAAAVLPVLLACAVASACGSRDPGLFPGPDREWAVLDEEAIAAIAEVLRLEDHRRFDPEVFERLLAHAQVEVRRRAATAAGRIGDRAATPVLLRALQADPSPDVRADAAFALGELGDSSAAVIAGLRAAVPPAWLPVRPEETPVVVEVLAALGKTGGSAAAGMIADALRDAQPGLDPVSGPIAAEALLAAWKFAGPGARVYAVAPYTSSSDPELRWRAAYALMRMARPEVVPLLLPLLGDPEHRVRAHAARGLPARLADSAAVRDSVLEALAERIDDPHPHVRINVLGAVATYGADAPLEAVEARLGDADPNVAIAAANALGEIGAAAASALARVAADPAAPVALRTTAAGRLARIEPARALSLVEDWAEGDFGARYGLARVLAELDWRRAGPPLRRLAEDRDDRVAVAALAAAGTLAADSALDPDAATGLRDLLLSASRAPEPRRRAAALEAVAPLLRPADAPLLLEAFERAAADPERPGARAAAIAAVQALGTLHEADAGVAAAFHARFPRPADPWVRRAVAEALDGAAEATPPRASDDPAFYEDVVRRYVAAPLAGRERPRAVIATAAGEVELELLAEEAPLTVANFVELARTGFYDEGVWHRVVPNFVLQDGAPAGHPSGGPGSRIRDEINRVRYDRGMLGMALAGPDTGGSQWFITHSPQPHLDGGYTVFGRVVEGMEAADRVVQGDPIHTIRVRP